MKLGLLFTFVLLFTACASPSQLEESSDIHSQSKTDLTQEAQSEITTLSWESTHFLEEVGVNVQNVTDLLVANDGRVFATYYDDNHINYVAYTEDGGKNWDWSALPDSVNYIRAIRQLKDGSFLILVTASGQNPLVYESKNGITWKPLEAEGESLTGPGSTAWDILELENGRILIATSVKDENLKESQSLYILENNELRQSDSVFDGNGILALEMNSSSIYAATQQSTEHDDPALAGQSSVYRSLNGGDTWELISQPEGANRIYDILISKNGEIFLGTGISGNFYLSKDGGESWIEQTHVPDIEKIRGDSPEPVFISASRIYQILELIDGTLVVGTGNNNGGSIFFSTDRGESWEQSSFHGNNNVTWALAQDPITGTIWAGTGSFGGDIWIAR